MKVTKVTTFTKNNRIVKNGKIMNVTTVTIMGFNRSYYVIDIFNSYQGYHSYQNYGVRVKL